MPSERMFAAASDVRLRRACARGSVSGVPANRRPEASRVRDLGRPRFGRVGVRNREELRAHTRRQGYGYLTTLRTLEADLQALDVGSG